MQPATTFLELLREQRHRFLNHLQVLSGWLQLSEPGRANRYLGKVVTALQVEGQLGRLEPPELALSLIRVHWVAQDQDVQVEWQVATPPVTQRLRPEGYQALGALLEQVVGLVARAEERRLMVRLATAVPGWQLTLAGLGLSALTHPTDSVSPGPAPAIGPAASRGAGTSGTSGGSGHIGASSALELQASLGKALAHLEAEGVRVQMTELPAGGSGEPASGNG